jgi:hypothetical protein
LVPCDTVEVIIQKTRNCQLNEVFRRKGQVFGRGAGWCLAFGVPSPICADPRFGRIPQKIHHFIEERDLEAQPRPATDGVKRQADGLWPFRLSRRCQKIYFKKYPAPPQILDAGERWEAPGCRNRARHATTNRRSGAGNRHARGATSPGFGQTGCPRRGVFRREVCVAGCSEDVRVTGSPEGSVEGDPQGNNSRRSGGGTAVQRYRPPEF